MFDSVNINNSLKRHGDFMFRRLSKSGAYAIGCKMRLGKLGQSLYNIGSGLTRDFIDTAFPTPDVYDENESNPIGDELVPLSDDSNSENEL